MSTTISGTSGVTFPDSTSMQTGQQACKAWVNFNGQGTVAIRAGYNVSSITDNGTGQYTVNFTTALADANYSTVVTTGGTSARITGNSPEASGNDPTVNSTSVTAYRDVAGIFVDARYMNVAVFSN